MLLFAAAHWIVDADLGRIDVEHPPRHRPVEHLAERLRRFEALARREAHPPLGDLLRVQLADLPVTEDRCRFAEQGAELLDRHRLDVVLHEIRLDKLVERESSCDPLLAP
jgi:hypothetical protein